MGKGDKQHGSREPKKPKATKAAPATAGLLKPQAAPAKGEAKPSSK